MDNVAKLISTSYKDGDDGDASDIKLVTIDVVDNGFIVTIIDESGNELREVYHDIDSVFNMIREEL